jgi:2-polyprenyl-6-methoxyphenol hydroxylase-like FAD-dependent oxidoreductase
LDVTVTTTTGRKFTGNIVVGADGIHSTVRQEMWKEAQKIDPSWIDPSEASGMYTAQPMQVFWLTIEKSTSCDVLLHLRYIGRCKRHRKRHAAFGIQRAFFILGPKRAW